MQREFKFAGSLAMSLLLLAGSFAVAQNAPTAKAKKPGAAATSSAAATGAGQSVTPPPAAQAPPVAITQASGATATAATTTAKPKTMVSADKRTIPVPQF